MAIVAEYEVLKETIDKLHQLSDALDDPIEQYMQNSKEIGIDGSAWSGTAAERVEPTLAAIKFDIERLQKACSSFEKSARESLQNYQSKDITIEKNITDIKA